MNFLKSKTGNSPLRLVVMFLALTTTCTGCREPGPEIVPVTGTVLKDGQPVANASITFFAKTGRPSYGSSDAEGRYTLEYAQDVEGAVVGEHTVTITKAGMGPPPAVDESAPVTRGTSSSRRGGSGGPMEVTLPQTITVSADMGDLDLIVPPMSS